MKLNDSQKNELFQDGYTLIPGVVPQIMIEEALKTINSLIGEHGRCPEHSGLPAIAGLYNATPARALAESVIGEGMIHPVDHGQIALRFPVFADPPPAPREHLDGLLQIKSGIVQNFTALLGIYLSDVTTDYAGNFTVWPGSHRAYERHLREHGVDVLLDGTPRIGIGEPRQIQARAGDMILCHYQLGHAAAINVRHHTRYAIFFRLDHKDRASDWKAPLTNIWMHWPGMAELLSGGGKEA